MNPAPVIPEAFSTVIKALPIYSNVFVYIDAVVIKMPSENIAHKYVKEAKHIIESLDLPLTAGHNKRSNTFFIKPI